MPALVSLRNTSWINEITKSNAAIILINFILTAFICKIGQCIGLKK